ncbi:MAG: hypothetical protein LW809_02760 [Vampirovibrionales bacterium]|jgi:hypothetical protein|nr:hypothetical protein [Vampirovibrionales bacterium]
MDPQLVREIYEGIQKHPFPTKGIFQPRLIKESEEVSNTIGNILGVNPETAQVSTFQVDSFQPFAEKYKEYSNRKNSKGTCEKASINALSFITPTGSKKSPVALHIGQYFQEFVAKGKPVRTIYDYAYGTDYMNVPGSTHLTNGLGDYGYLNSHYSNITIPLVAEKIDGQASVRGSIIGTYNPEQKRSYTGLATANDVNQFLKKNPDLFSDASTIREWYG